MFGFSYDDGFADYKVCDTSIELINYTQRETKRVKLGFFVWGFTHYSL